MTDKVVFFLVEGPTEVEFYKAVVKFAHDTMKTEFSYSVEWINMKGIGNYKSRLDKRFQTYKKKHPSKDIYAFLCIDTDVFEFAPKPPIDKEEAKRILKRRGAKEVYYIEAQSSIEDWFLDDFSGVCSYLGLPSNTKRKAGVKGQEMLQQLFSSKNRAYVKGSKIEGFISKLNIGKIMSVRCKEMHVLCSLMGFDCKKLCHEDGLKW